MPKGKANKRYTPEFKIKVVEMMQKEKLIYREAARQFDISDHHNVARWERIYLDKVSPTDFEWGLCPIPPPKGH